MYLNIDFLTLSFHDRLCDFFELGRVDYAVSVKVEHPEGDLEVAPRRRQQHQNEHVVFEVDVAAEILKGRLQLRQILFRHFQRFLNHNQQI